MATNNKHTEGKLWVAMGGTQIWANNVTTICYMNPELPESKENAKRIAEAWNNWDEAQELIIEMGKMLLYDDIYPEGSKGYNLANRAISFTGKTSS